MANIKTVLDNVASGAIKLAASSYKGTYTPMPNVMFHADPVPSETWDEGIEIPEQILHVDGVVDGKIIITLDEKSIPKPEFYPVYEYKVENVIVQGFGEMGNFPVEINAKDIELENYLVEVVYKKVRQEGYRDIAVIQQPIEGDIIPPKEADMTEITGATLVAIEEDRKVLFVPQNNFNLKIKAVLDNTGYTLYGWDGIQGIVPPTPDMTEITITPETVLNSDIYMLIEKTN